MKTDTNINNPKEKSLVDVTNGKKPSNQFEEDLKKDIEKIKAEGRVVEIPSDI